MTQGYKVGQRIKHPTDGKIGKVVFISPVNHRIYVEFGRTSESWVSFSVGQLATRHDLFAPIH